MEHRITHLCTTERQRWQPSAIDAPQSGDALRVTAERRQRVLGFGGCFNELGWDALQAARPELRQQFLDELFSGEGCNFNYGRIPVGANDFSLQWYSCDETPGDYELRDFNIDRDKQYTIPFVREALARQKDFWVFASPWSPPTWMKTKPVYNFGRMRMEPAVLDAYARYFVRFVRAYAEQGVRVAQIHPQNEPMADQKFPSCLWDAQDMLVFIRDYLGPALSQSGLGTELWLGTINGPFANTQIGNSPYREFFDPFMNRILSDEQARRYIAGIGLQWGGKHHLDQLDAAYPEIPVMQTESECGDGANSWTHMEYIFQQMWQYFRRRAQRYTYWNLALMQGGESSWGWRQNSLATVDGETGALTLQPEFYLLKHFSHFVAPGARVVAVEGRFAATSVAFENPDGSLVAVVCNSMDVPRTMDFVYGDVAFSARLEGHSLHTFKVMPN